MNLRDLMGNAPLAEAARAALSVADALQHHPRKGVRLMGLCVAFLLAAGAAGMSVPDLMGMARNCIHSAKGRRAEFAAVNDYLREEVFRA